MNYMKIFSYSCLLLFIVLYWSCKKEAMSSTDAPLNPDTRVLVQEAFRKVDTMTLTASFNAERAEIIRKRFEKETDGPKKLTLATDYAQELLKCGKMRKTKAQSTHHADAITPKIDNALGM